MTQEWDRWAVLRIKKAGGMVELVSTHKTRDAAKAEADQLTTATTPYRFSVMLVRVSEQQSA